MKLDEIQPSQLYISRSKQQRINELVKAHGESVLHPLPVKHLGEDVVYSDGHTRALTAMMRGMTEIQVWWDEDDMDWEAYEVCVGWCKADGIRTVADLEGRELDDDDYQRLWLDRCQRLFEDLGRKGCQS